jgi:uncharacterized protein YndB with AHSA1/START domain
MTGPGDPTSAVVRRVLPATPDVVYAEWLDPEALAEFICPYPVTPGIVQCDPRVGGTLHIVMIDPAAVVNVTGEYLELDRPNRLRFTWNSDFGGGFASVVTVTFEPHGDGQTLMTIDHAHLPPQWRDDHDKGWTLIAAQLERVLRAVS